MPKHLFRTTRKKARFFIEESGHYVTVDTDEEQYGAETANLIYVSTVGTSQR